jgi:hypothetical protein
VSSFFDRWAWLAELEASEDDDLITAGVDRLSAFGYLNTILELVQVTGLNYTEILEQPAGTVFAIIARESVKSDIKRKVDKIREQRAKLKK